MNETLSEENFLLFAAKHYENPSCYNVAEFYDDLKRFKYIKRLFNRYIQTKNLKERLILNHIIIIYNIFGPEAATKMLFFKLEGYYKYLKPFLVLLNFCPKTVFNIRNKDIDTTDILMDEGIISKLREI